MEAFLLSELCPPLCFPLYRSIVAFNCEGGARYPYRAATNLNRASRIALDRRQQLLQPMRPIIILACALLFGGCSSHPEAEKSSSFVVSGADSGEYAVPDPKDPDFLAVQLKHYGLDPLSADNTSRYVEQYRFLWLRSFHRAAVFELKFTADGTGIYEAKLWEEIAGRRQWVVKRTIQSMDAAVELESKQRWLACGRFFELPFADNRGGLDGAEWFIEVKQGSKYHAVYRWSPSDSFVREFGRSLIESAIESEFLPIY